MASWTVTKTNLQHSANYQNQHQNKEQSRVSVDLTGSENHHCVSLLESWQACEHPIVVGLSTSASPRSSSAQSLLDSLSWCNAPVPWSLASSHCTCQQLLLATHQCTATSTKTTIALQPSHRAISNSQHPHIHILSFVKNWTILLEQLFQCPFALAGGKKCIQVGWRMVKFSGVTCTVPILKYSSERQNIFHVNERHTFAQKLVPYGDWRSTSARAY